MKISLAEPLPTSVCSVQCGSLKFIGSRVSGAADPASQPLATASSDGVHIGDCTAAELKTIQAACKALSAAVSQRLNQLESQPRRAPGRSHSRLSVLTGHSSGVSSPMQSSTTLGHAVGGVMHEALVTGELGLWQSIEQTLFFPTPPQQALPCSDSASSVHSTLWATTEPSDCGTFRGGTLRGRQATPHSPPSDSFNRPHLNPVLGTSAAACSRQQHRPDAPQALSCFAPTPISRPMARHPADLSDLPLQSPTATRADGFAAPIPEGSASAETDDECGVRDLFRNGATWYPHADTPPTLSSPSSGSSSSSGAQPAIGRSPPLSASLPAGSTDLRRSSASRQASSSSAGDVIIGFPSASSLPPHRRRDASIGASSATCGSPCRGAGTCSLLSASVTRPPSTVVPGCPPGVLSGAASPAEGSLHAKMAAAEIRAAWKSPLVATLDGRARAIPCMCTSSRGTSSPSVERIKALTGRHGIPPSIAADMAELGYHRPVRVCSSCSLRGEEATMSPAPSDHSYPP